MDIRYNNNKLLKDGEFLKVSETQIQPEIKLNVDPNEIYTLIVHDPNAVGGNKIHWARINIKNGDIHSGKDIIPYLGPAPPRYTGIHHYIFELYKQKRENKLGQIETRAFKMNNFRNKLKISRPIYSIKFISDRENKIHERKLTRRKLIHKKPNRSRRIRPIF